MTPQDALLQAWKRQLDVGFGAMETFLEGMAKLYEAQLDAACAAHADTVATHKEIARASDPAELFRLQSEWFLGNARRYAECCCALEEGALRTSAEIAGCVGTERKAA